MATNIQISFLLMGVRRQVSLSFIGILLNHTKRDLKTHQKIKSQLPPHSALTGLNVQPCNRCSQCLELQHFHSWYYCLGDHTPDISRYNRH